MLQERAKWQYQEATRRNQLKRQHEIEHEGFVPAEEEEKRLSKMTKRY